MLYPARIGFHAHMEAFLSLYDVAARLGVHPVTVRRLVRRGELAAVKVGSGQNARIRISERALDSYLASAMVAA